MLPSNGVTTHLTNGLIKRLAQNEKNNIIEAFRTHIHSKDIWCDGVSRSQQWCLDDWPKCQKIVHMLPIHSKNVFWPTTNHHHSCLISTLEFYIFNLKCSKSVKFFVDASRRYGTRHGIRWYTVAHSQTHKNNSVNRKKNIHTE